MVRDIAAKLQDATGKLRGDDRGVVAVEVGADEDCLGAVRGICPDKLSVTVDEECSLPVDVDGIFDIFSVAVALETEAHEAPVAVGKRSALARDGAHVPGLVLGEASLAPADLHAVAAGSGRREHGHHALGALLRPLAGEVRRRPALAPGDH